MKTRIFLALFVSMALLTGCLVTSVFPFYTAKDVASEPALLGDWVNSEQASEHWQFETNAGKYRLTFISQSETNIIEATFFKLQNHAFLDFYNSNIGEQTQPPPIPSHFLFRVNQTSQKLIMASIDYEWLCNTLSNSPAALAHHWSGMSDEPDKNRLVLTANTAELQRFVLKYYKDTNAWDKPLELSRAALSSKTGEK